MVVGEEAAILAAPELVEKLIGNLNLIIRLFQATGLVVLAWLAFSAAKWWTVRKEYKEIKAIHRDLNKIKKKLKID